MDNFGNKFTNNMKFYTQEECLIGLSEMQWKEFFELSFIKQIGPQFGVQNFSSVWGVSPKLSWNFSLLSNWKYLEMINILCIHH